MFKHWKTTLGGLGSILAGLAMAAQSASAGDWAHLPEAFAAVAAGVGLLKAADAGTK